MIAIVKHKCRHCGHPFQPRTPSPRQCPRCWKMWPLGQPDKEPEGAIYQFRLNQTDEGWYWILHYPADRPFATSYPQPDKQSVYGEIDALIKALSEGRYTIRDVSK